MVAERSMFASSRRMRRMVTGSALALITLSATGCNNAVEGGFSGAALGAGAGAIIGSLSGDFGTGAAIGAVAGGLGGAIIGDQNQRADSRAYRDYSPRDRVSYDHCR